MSCRPENRSDLDRLGVEQHCLVIRDTKVW